MGFGGCDDNSDCHCVVIWVVMVLGVVVRREVSGYVSLVAWQVSSIRDVIGKIQQTTMCTANVSLVNR